MKLSLRIKICFVVCALLVSCANPLPPPGGPEDTTPPEIVSVAPESGTINYGGGEIDIEFSEWMNRTSIYENVFISPDVKLEYKWYRKTLKIKFAEELEENTTYSLFIGTDYSDLSQNRPAEAFNMIFSTGSDIDSGRIVGKLFGLEIDGAFVYAYRIDNIDPDTLDISKVPPRYRTQIGTSGEFEFLALKDGKYRVFALKDEFKNKIYDEGIDRFGAAPKDVVVTQDSTPLIELKLGPKIDRIRPQLFSVESTGGLFLTTTFSEALDSTTVSARSFVIRDSAGTEEIEPASAYPIPNESGSVEVILPGELDTTRTYELFVSDAEFYVPKDLADNPTSDTARSAYFNVYPGDEKRIPEIVSISIADSAKGFKKAQTIDFYFNIGMNFEDYDKNFRLIDSDSNSVDIVPDHSVDNIVKIKPKGKLETTSWYRVYYDSEGAFGDNGEPARDTSYSVTFQTGDFKRFGAIKGKIENPDACGPGFVIAIRSESTGDEYTSKIKPDGSFEFAEVEPGEYEIEIFCDGNSNGKYDFGKAFPHEFSERFFFPPKKIEVKARWTVEDLMLEFE